jgi:hypothetical protein
MLPTVPALELRTTRPRRGRALRLWLIWGIPTLLALPVLIYMGRPVVARLAYRPSEGDVVFQSLPPSRLSVAIEGATRSRYSHCGIVAKRDGRWVVLEAYRGVEETGLWTWLSRGQGGGFVVYRLQPPHDRHVSAMIAAARTYVGRPYDSRYRWDDERIYCSELVAKAYEAAADESLGRRVRLGELNWRPFQSTIEHFEGGPPPLDREMITPRDLAQAEQLAEVYRFGLSD